MKQHSQYCPSWPVTIFIAGNPLIAKDVCQDYCDRVGLCVTLETCTYIYTNGHEAGMRIGLINYARFPSYHDVIEDHAKKIADLLLVALDQQSYTIQTPRTSTWVSIRPENLK